MKNAKLQELEQNMLEARNKLREANRQYHEYRDSIEIPKLKKKYEGKFFIGTNGYSDTPKWNTYTYVKEVVSESEAIMFSFEITSLGEGRFSCEKGFINSYCGKQISREVFIDACTVFASTFQAFIPNL